MTCYSRLSVARACCCLAVVFSGGSSLEGFAETNLPAPPSQTSGRETTTNDHTLGPVEGFTKALGFLSGRVNVFETNGVIRVSRTDVAGWKVELHGYKELPATNILVFVTDSGAVRAELKNGADTDSWMRTTPTGSMNSGRDLRPETAFRKAIASLKWHPSQVDLFGLDGHISFHRTEYGSWFMKLSGYSRASIQGIGVIIEDDGSTKHAIAF